MLAGTDDTPKCKRYYEKQETQQACPLVLPLCFVNDNVLDKGYIKL